MSEHIITPADLALFDQGYAASEEILYQLIESFRVVREAEKAEGHPEAVAIWALVQHIKNEWDLPAISSALGVAVVVLDSYMANCTHEDLPS